MKLKTLERAFEIIRYVASEGEVTAKDVETRFELPTSTAFDYLGTLEKTELLVKEGDTYRLGCRLLEFGSKARWNLDIYRPARSELDDLATETNEQVYLMKEENGWGVTLYNASGNPRVNVEAYDGLYTPLHTTAGGKAILAYTPQRQLEAIYPDGDLCSINDKTITGWNVLLEELAEIRERGVAFEREERVEGISSIGAPIVGRDGGVIGSVAIFGPTSRIEDKANDDGPDPNLVNRMKEVVNVIEVNLYS